MEKGRDKVQGSRKHIAGNSLTDHQIYHLLMLAYPGYTVRGIENELSWREVRLLLDCWDKQPPGYLTDRKAEKVLERAYGVTFAKRQLSSDQLIAKLEGLGWL